MQSSKFKEASLLEGRIAVLEHVEALVHGPAFSTVPRHELRAHINAISNEGLHLPTSMRLKVHEQFANWSLGDLLEIKNHKSDEFKKAVDEHILKVIAFAAPTRDYEASELNLTISFILDGLGEEIDFKRRFRSMSEEEAKTEQASLEEARASPCAATISLRL